MSTRNYIPFLKERGLPLDIANIINERATWEYRDYEKWALKFLPYILGQFDPKYVNIEVLIKDIVDVLISLFGLTFSDFLNIVSKIGPKSFYTRLQELGFYLSNRIFHFSEHQPSLDDAESYNLIREFFTEKGRKSGYLRLDENIEEYLTSLKLL